MESHAGTKARGVLARILRGVGRGWLAAGCVVALAALGATDSFAQSTATIAAYQYPSGQQQTLSSGGTAYINPQDYYNNPMPEVAFYITNASSFSCTQVEWSITVNYTDPDNYGTNYSNNWYSSSCGATFTINPGDWGDDVGGTATMTATLYCNSSEVATGSFQFYILGSIQSETQVDTVKSEFGMPWFTGSMITYESCSHWTGGSQDQPDQFSPSSDYFCSPSQNLEGHPVWGSPDGIGLMQPDRTKDGQYFINATYWNYATNMATVLDVLNDAQGGAYSFWDSQVEQMCTWTRGTYSSGTGTGYATCSAVQQPDTGANPATGPTYAPGSADFYTPESLPNCASHFTSLSDGQPSGWRDADWIKAYNGVVTYYIFWHKDFEQPNSYQYWVFNNCSGSTCNDYVPEVCNAADY